MILVVLGLRRRDNQVTDGDIVFRYITIIQYTDISFIRQVSEYLSLYSKFQRAVYPWQTDDLNTLRY